MNIVYVPHLISPCALLAAPHVTAGRLVCPSSSTGPSFYVMLTKATGWTKMSHT